MEICVKTFIECNEKDGDVFLAYTYEDGEQLYYVGACKHVFDVEGVKYIFFNNIKRVEETLYYWIYWKNYIECKIYEPTFTELQVL